MLRKVSKELHPCVAWVLERDGIPYSAQDMGGYMEIQTEGVSSRRFSNVVEDAKCEKERRESLIPDIPVLSYRAAMNPERMVSLLNSYGANCFVICEGEEQRYFDTVRNL